MTRFKPQDFKKFFTLNNRPTCFNASLMLSGSSRIADLLITCNAGSGYIFINKEKEKRTQDIGVALYGDHAKYEQFLSDLKAYIAEAENTIVKKYTSIRSNLTKEEFLTDYKFVAKLWDFYGYMEFPFMDN